MTLRHYSFLVITVVIACYFDHLYSLPTRPKAVECKGIKLTKIGCFLDKQNKPRPLPELVLTDRDTTSPVYTNITIRWIDWDNYMRGLICRCAAKSLKQGYDKIGLQNYGECWSGPKSAALAFARDGPSGFCITFGGKKCKGGVDCVGEDYTNFVYDVQEDKPSGSPTNKPTTKETTPKRTTKPTPTPSQTPSPTPSPSTPSPSPNPSTPSPTSSPTSRPSPTPSGSATSTAKTPSSKPTSSGPSKPTSSGPSKPTSSGPSKPTSSGPSKPTSSGPSKPTSSGPSKPTSSNPCQSTNCPGTGQRRPCQYPPCLPQQPVAYPAVITGCPQLQCPTQCAPQCAVSCCNSLK